MVLRRTWGHATALFHRTRQLSWIDLAIVVGLAGFLWGVVDLAREWTHELRPAIEIDLDDPWTLPQYTFFSLSIERGLRPRGARSKARRGAHAGRPDTGQRA